MSLKIKNLTTGESAEIVRDVCHTHPEWVHGQCGSSSESELQIMLDQTGLADYLRNAGEPDECGIYWDGDVFRVTCTAVDGNGVEIGNETAEALGEYACRLFADEGEAQEAADDLADGSAFRYGVRRA